MKLSKTTKTKEPYHPYDSEYAKYLRGRVVAKLTEMLDGNAKLAEEIADTKRHQPCCLARLRMDAVDHVVNTDVTKPSMRSISAAIGLNNSALSKGILQRQTKRLRARGLA